MSGSPFRRRGQTAIFDIVKDNSPVASDTRVNFTLPLPALQYQYRSWQIILKH